MADQGHEFTECAAHRARSRPEGRGPERGRRAERGRGRERPRRCAGGECRKVPIAGDADDEARAGAAELADQTARAVEAEVETEVGERDPLLAVEDALALFPADEILVAGTADERTDAGLRRLHLPIYRVGAGDEVDGEPATGAESYARDVAKGQREDTPFVIVGTVAAILFALIAFISLIAFLAMWLA